MTKGDYENSAAFRDESRRFLSFSEQAAKGARLATQQYLALPAIVGFPSRAYIGLTKQGRARLRALARAHQTELQTVGPLLVRLSKQVVRPARSPKA